MAKGVPKDYVRVHLEEHRRLELSAAAENRLQIPKGQSSWQVNRRFGCVLGSRHFLDRQLIVSGL